MELSQFNILAYTKRYSATAPRAPPPPPPPPVAVVLRCELFVISAAQPGGHSRPLTPPPLIALLSGQLTEVY